MIPNLPRPLLWTEIKTMKEFLNGDFLTLGLYDIFKKIQDDVMPYVNAVTFFNELYYQLTRYYYEKPGEDDYPRYYADIRTNLGRVECADLVVTMMFHYCRLRSHPLHLMDDPFMSTIQYEQEMNDFWRYFVSSTSTVFHWDEFVPYPQKPCPASPKTLGKLDLDWRKITQNYNLDIIQEVIGLWNKPEDKTKIITMIYDFAADSGRFSDVPYTFDKLLENLYKKYDANHKGFLLNEFALSSKKNIYDVFMKGESGQIKGNIKSDVLLKQNEELKAKVKQLENSNKDLQEKKNKELRSREDTEGILKLYLDKLSAKDRDIDEIFEDEAPKKKGLSTPLAGVLATDQAKKYWERLRKKNFVDSRYMLLKETTRQQASYIAESFALKLGITTKWKTFQDFWGIKNLAQEKNQMKQIGKLPSRAKEIDEIFED